ncbi:MAG: PDZ domain-containing protein, partial [Acidobacteria bacterium]|nr:PDZ domain-containing protein [Acidobacteriota bacterium]
RGEVIGINTQISTNSGVYNGIGFALPSSMIVSIYNQLMSSGKVERGFLGIVMRAMEPEMARVFEIPDGNGVLVEDLSDVDSPAAQAGLKSGDVIIAFDGEPVRSPRDLSRRVGSTSIGQSVDIKYIRDGKAGVARVKVGLRPPRPSGPTPSRPADEQKKENSSEGEFPLRKQGFGAKLEAPSAHVMSVLKLESSRGVVVADTEEGGFADELELATGDVIIRLNRIDVLNPDHFRTLLGDLKRGDPMVLEVIRPRRLGNTAGHVFLSSSVP